MHDGEGDGAEDAAEHGERGLTPIEASVVAPASDHSPPAGHSPVIVPRPRREGDSQHQFVSRQEFRMSVGVLTDPKSLAEYEKAVPGCGKQILDKYFAQVEREQQHRHQTEKDSLLVDSRNYDRLLHQGDRGQWMALVVALAGLLLVGWLAYVKEPLLAGIVATLDLGGLVSVFIYGRKKQTEEALAEDEPTEPSPEHGNRISGPPIDARRSLPAPPPKDSEK